MRSKQKRFVLCAAAFALLIFGCAKKAGGAAESLSAPEKNPRSASESAAEKIDIDFTKMNFNMISGVMFDTLVNSDKYIGKTVAFSGKFFTDFNEMFGRQTFSVIMYDETACCQTGFDFVPSGMAYPADFPKEKADITVSGTFAFEQIGDIGYFYIACDKIL